MITNKDRNKGAYCGKHEDDGQHFVIFTNILDIEDDV